MSKQIAVRIPNELVEFVDSLVAHGEASSRADVVARALVREQRRLRTLKDIAILCSSRQSDDLDELAAFGANQQIDLD